QCGEKLHCVKKGLAATTGICVADGPAPTDGGACVTACTSESGFYCDKSDGSEGVCRPVQPRNVGDACDHANGSKDVVGPGFCADASLYCKAAEAGTAGVCAAYGASGDACSNTAPCNSKTATCNGATSLCVALPAETESCDEEGRCQNGLSC